MLKNITQLTVQVGEKVYHLLCDNDSPIAHVKEAIFEFTKSVAQIEQNIKDAQQSSQEVEKVNESEVKTEEV